jgi:hypothetical protein
MGGSPASPGLLRVYVDADEATAAGRYSTW